MLKRVFPDSYRMRPASKSAIVIHPAALPHNAGVRLAAGFSPGPHGAISINAPIVVYASPHCTGS